MHNLLWLENYSSSCVPSSSRLRRVIWYFKVSATFLYFRRLEKKKKNWRLIYISPRCPRTQHLAEREFSEIARDRSARLFSNPTINKPGRYQDHQRGNLFSHDLTARSTSSRRPRHRARRKKKKKGKLLSWLLRLWKFLISRTMLFLFIPRFNDSSFKHNYRCVIVLIITVLIIVLIVLYSN